MKATLDRDRLETVFHDKKPLYPEGEARAEAERCLYCVDAPCIKACPTEIDIPTFIKKIATGNVRGSAQTIFEQNLLGYSCARVCPVEVLCEGSCVYNAWEREPIKIGRLQRFATDAVMDAKTKPIFVPRPLGTRKVALIGAGPASVACAGYLQLEGVQAVIFEKRAVPGGLNTWGIAPYKLQAEDAIHEISWVERMGVEIKLGVEIGKDISVKELLDGYDALFIGVGLGDDTRLGIPGEDGPGVVGAVAWIEEMKLHMKKGERLGNVVIVGGGNTAIDVARECAQLGARDVTMVYRRGRADMSGYVHEMMGARKERVHLMENTQPISVKRTSTGSLVGLECLMTKDGKNIPGTEHFISCDFVALAIGQSKLRAVAKELPGVELDQRGCVVCDPKTGRTGNAKVYSGGDCTNGGKEVVNAVADGRNAARTMLASFAPKSGRG